jgi:hypothetical protein
MNTRNKFGCKDWHIAVILFNIVWAKDLKWIYLFQITDDDGDGRCLFKYIRCDEGWGHFATYVDLFWISFVVERDPNYKFVWLSSHGWAHSLCNHLWNRWAHKEDWRN